MGKSRRSLPGPFWCENKGVERQQGTGFPGDWSWLGPSDSRTGFQLLRDSPLEQGTALGTAWPCALTHHGNGAPEIQHPVLQGEVEPQVQVERRRLEGVLGLHRAVPGGDRGTRSRGAALGAGRAVIPHTACASLALGSAG